MRVLSVNARRYGGVMTVNLRVDSLRFPLCDHSFFIDHDQPIEFASHKSLGIEDVATNAMALCYLLDRIGPDIRWSVGFTLSNFSYFVKVRAAKGDWSVTRGSPTLGIASSKYNFADEIVIILNTINSHMSRHIGKEFDMEKVYTEFDVRARVPVPCIMEEESITWQL